MAYNSTVGVNQYTSEGNVYTKYGITSTDYALEAQIAVDGKPVDIVILLRSPHANAGALNGAAAYAALPNGSIAIGGTTSPNIIYKGSPDGKTDSVWA